MSKPQTQPNRALVVGWLGLLGFALATIFITFAASKPWQEDYAGIAWAATIAFAAWGATPHLGLSALLLLFKRATKVKSAIAVSIALLIVSCGLALIVDVVFIHPDAQGGIALAFVPFYQWMASIIVAVFGAIVFVTRSDSLPASSA
ncbi:MAG: hypothetical protein AAF585_05185 [Verrucomicrobiota bacterium]